MEKKIVHIKPRHHRLLFLVEHDISWKDLTRIIHGNLKIWGGRYNPIIPVRNGKISQAYLDMIKRLDPDMVYYNPAVEIESIKKLEAFNPSRYVKMDSHTSYFGGVDYHYLLNENNRDFLHYRQQLPILHIEGSHRVKLKAKDFYETNFGLFEIFHNQDHLIRGYEVHPITKENHEDINKIIIEKRVYFKSILSQLKVFTNICRPKDLNQAWRFVLIVADPEKSNEDLFYFWNRQQYVSSNRQLLQIILTKENFSDLLEDLNFGGVLQRLEIESMIYVTSKTITDANVKKMIAQLQEKFIYTRFQQIESQPFPYPILDYEKIDDLRREATKQIFTGTSDLIKLPPLRFNNHQILGNSVVDIEVETSDQITNRIMYPYSVSLHHKGRINRLHFESHYVNHEDAVIEYSIPSDENIIHTRLLRIKDDKGDQVSTGVEDVRLSSDGRKLFALINLFKGNWFHLIETIDEKFWLDLFRYKSELSKSAIPKSKAIFSYKDLQTERFGIYRNFADSIEKKRSQAGDTRDISTIIEECVKRDFEAVNYMLQDFIDLNAVYIGVKIGCNTCGANKWYSLKELHHKMNCGGCDSTIIPKMEAPYYYKVNEILVNNLLSDATGNKKSFHGNYVVLRALNWLKSSSRQGFSYCCPTDIKAKSINTDLDILAIQDGKFVLGEAKVDAGDFSPAEIKNLIWVGNNIKPDKLILAYHTGKLGDDRIEELRKGVKNAKCEIVIYHASKPKYWFGDLFGLPK